VPSPRACVVCAAPAFPYAAHSPSSRFRLRRAALLEKVRLQVGWRDETRVRGDGIEAEKSGGRGVDV
jgi:hypothetical protein